METDKNNQSMDTAIESEDDNEGNTITDKLRANPDELKAGPQPLGGAEVRRRNIEEELPEKLRRCMLDAGEMHKHPQHRRGAKLIIADLDEPWGCEDDERRVW